MPQVPVIRDYTTEFVTTMEMDMHYTTNQLLDLAHEQIAKSLANFLVKSGAIQIRSIPQGSNTKHLATISVFAMETRIPQEEIDRVMNALRSGGD